MTLFFMNESITLNAYTGYTTGNGYTDSTYAASSTITCSVQEVVGEDLKRAVELGHTEDNKFVFTQTELNIKDKLTIDSDTYEVWQVIDCTRQPFLQHYECLAERVES